MASIKVKFRHSTVAGREGTIYYQIIHERKVRQLVTDYRISSSEWDERRSMVVTSLKSDRKTYIHFLKEYIYRDLERFTRIVRKLDSQGLNYTSDDVIEEFKRYTCKYSLINFMQDIIIKLQQKGKIRTAETYRATLNNFRKFLDSQPAIGIYHHDKDIMLDFIDSEIMEAYEAWHHTRGITPNTISFYTRVLRAVYNRAVEYEIIENRYPFRRVYTGIDKTIKRALPLHLISRIKELDLSFHKGMDYARDMFILSFMLRGMSFVDMAYLRKSDLSHGYITYRRRKTGQLLIIKWTKEMQTILDKYPPNMSDYLLPIIKKPGFNDRGIYRYVGYTINQNLKKVAEIIGISMPLTLYVARHSWASAAKAKGIPLHVISEGMGHDSETTTQIYLASLDTSIVDKANSLIIRSL